jgi:drug/metabolite transporter (DMT)-like permease
MLLALFLLAGMDAIAKHLTETLAVPQILAIRFWVFLTFALALTQRAGFRRTVRSARPGVQILRSLVMVGQMSAFIIAVSHMPLADVHAVVAVAPLLVMALAALFLGEPIGPRRAAAVGVGFIGVLVIIRPGTGVFDPMSLVALAGASCWAVFQILLRVVGGRDSAETTTLFSAAIGFICFTLVVPFVWRAPDPTAWLWLLAVGVIGSVGHYLLSTAFRYAPASTLQPFAYTMPIWAAVFGWLGFGHVPDRWTVIGGGIIIASGLYALRRERVAAVVR